MFVFVNCAVFSGECAVFSHQCSFTTITQPQVPVKVIVIVSVSLRIYLVHNRRSIYTIVGIHTYAQISVVIPELAKDVH